MEPGESWAYRARGVDPLVEVIIVRIGERKPARTLVRFVADEFEGREEWVPPARLKVPWSQVGELIVREARWDRALGGGLGIDDARWDAADELIRLLGLGTWVHLKYREGGCLRVSDPNGLLELLNAEKSLLEHPAAFEDDGVLVVPWSVTEQVMRTAARREPERVLQYVRGEERKAEHEAIHGHRYRGLRGGEEWSEPEDDVEFDSKYMKPVRETLRSWSGTEAAERFDELAELRKEVRRVGQLAESAIKALRAAGAGREAAAFSLELGEPVEMLQIEPQNG